MAKQKKKRNKLYTGVDASISRPVITRISAENRGPIKQWWLEHKRVAKPLIITVAVISLIIILIIELVRISSGF